MHSVLSEPVLAPEDHRRWEVWKRTCMAHAKTQSFARAVQRSIDLVHQMMERAPGAYAALSGGKDSTAMVTLLVEAGARPRVMSIKDDLDFPGEEDYVRDLCAGLSLEIDVLRPPISLQGWLQEHAHELPADEDMHSRSSAFSSACFYSLVEEYRTRRGSPGVYLGLRKYESRGRMMNRITRGAIYTKEDGETVCQPLCDWSGRDVFAYLFSRGAPILPMYRCCRFAESPDRIRKSWWLPGSHSRKGGMIWLRVYYPSLYQRLCELMPDAKRLA